MPLVFLTLFVFLAGAFTPVYAADTTVLVGSIYEVLQPYIVQAVAVLAAAVVGWLAELVRRYLNLNIDQRNRDALQRALTTGAGLLLSRLEEQANKMQFDVKNPVVKDVVDHVIASSPDAIKYFGLTPEVLAEKIAAKVALIKAGTINA